MFRSSALYRDKWERDDYRIATIDAGIATCNGIFHRSKMEHLQYILVRDNGKQALLKYVYEDGCYRFYADNMLLGIIKEYIADYD